MLAVSPASVCASCSEVARSAEFQAVKDLVLGDMACQLCLVQSCGAHRTVQLTRFWNPMRSGKLQKCSSMQHADHWINSYACM